MRRRNRKGILLALIPVILIGCASSREGTERSETRASSSSDSPSDSSVGTLSTDEAIDLISALEQNPLSDEASTQRTILTAWVVASPEVGPLVVEDVYIKPLQESDYQYGPELFLQYMFGLARAQATKKGSSHNDIIESGLKSLLAAYKSMALLDSALHTPFLDNLDRMRQQGRLGEYIRTVEQSKGN